ncbi:putative membrane-anchored protein [Erwinia toletana]|uniref:Membrane-anchored protein n=1 Tax=Winslowiella toletana TaxID=92490 RepID=A0ABS4PG58_9GAMM|nr:hypothetical protein [Winslowiella toletana]MBP2171071.1 putative membrane-anchored protein [Winslowiella toletana]
MHSTRFDIVSKVPEITMMFWLIKILATTLGETGGDALSMSMELGYLVSTIIFAAIFIAAVTFQVKATDYKPALYWFTIIATTTVGTTLADFADRSIGIGYAGGSALLLTLMLISFGVWYVSVGKIDCDNITTPKAERFYWLTIMFSQTLGTALGDWMADDAGFGYAGSTVVFGGALIALALAYKFTRLSRTLLFWAAFILTRPLGAVIGDFLDKPLSKGGLELSRYGASATLLLGIVVLVTLSVMMQRRKAITV